MSTTLAIISDRGKSEKVQLESTEQNLVQHLILKLNNTDMKYSDLAQRLKLAEGYLLTSQQHVIALEIRISKQLNVLNIYNLCMHPLLF